MGGTSAKPVTDDAVEARRRGRIPEFESPAPPGSAAPRREFKSMTPALYAVSALLVVTSLATATVGMVVSNGFWWVDVSWLTAGLFASIGTAHAVGRAIGAWRRTWIALLAGSVVWLAGTVVWTYYYETRYPASPNVADVSWYLFGIAAIAAMYELLSPSNVLRRAHWAELAILTFAVGAGVIAALAESAANSPLDGWGRAAAIAYPVLFASVPVVLAQAILVGPAEMRRSLVIRVLFAGMIVEAVAFIWWAPQYLSFTYVAGNSVADPLWSIGMVGIGVAALLARPGDVPKSEPEAAITTGLRRGILPACAFFCLVGGLVVAESLESFDMTEIALAFGIGLVGTVLVVRLLVVQRSQQALLVSERAAFDELRQTRAAADRFFEISRDIMLVAGPDRLVIKVNPAWKRILGWDDSAVIGKRLIDFTHPDDAGPTHEAMLKLLGGEEIAEFSNRFRARDGSWHWLTWQVLFNEDDGNIYGRATDTTESRRMSRMLAQLNDELAERAEELERSNTDLQQFASIASHELREPLRTVAGFASLIERRYRDQLDEKANDYIDFIVKGAERMNALIEALLTVSRVGQTAAARADVDTAELLEAVMRDMASAIETSGARVSIGTLPPIKADPHLITWVFQNLISNAIKYCDTERPEISIEGAERKDGWEISVADNGIGIDPRHADRIFTIFQRLHGRDEYAGTGIGLAVSKRAVELHGGTIWVEPGESGGSRFVFKIPFPADRSQDGE